MGKIAFEGTGGIHLIDPDGSNEKVLTTGSYPVWSPDGKKIAFLDDGLEIINIDGSGKQKLAATGNLSRNLFANFAVWSPDGKKIAFNDTLNNKLILKIVDISGENLTTLAEGDWSQYGFASDFSPTSNRVAYCKEGTANIINTDGTTEALSAGCSYPYYIKWSSDGKYIVTSRSIIDVDKKTSIDVDISEFSLSPDGKKIAYVSSSYGMSYAVNIDGTQNTKIYEPCYTAPSWSPDGKQIACNGGINGAPGIIVMNSDGSESKKIVDTIDLDIAAVWSPK